ncbi:MAG: ABC transporter ATP-binding protein [Elusimicrobia bacterium]|nr:ABC transporter ATP-binding protein [Elusimicrobiota bacterium]
MAALIEAVSLRREFGETVAVDGISFAVEQGAVCALVGPNGAGKTTLLRMLAGLLEPSGGTAVIDGVDLRADAREVHQKLGFLPDTFGLYEDLTAREYLEYFHLAYRLDPARVESRSADVLRQVGLGEAADKPIDSLSRGMRQRLGLARTLLHDPRLLLLDEPASGLDPGARNDLQELLQRLAGEGKTILVSSHILAELESYCSHLIILDHGRLVYSGSLKEARQEMDHARRLRVAALGDLRVLRDRVLEFPGASDWRLDKDAATFEFAGDEREAARLLKSLVSAGVEVTDFGEAGGTLQDSYLMWMGRETR